MKANLKEMIVSYIEANSGCRINDIMKSTKRSRTTVHMSLERLIRDKRVESNKNDKTYYQYYLVK